MTAHRVILGMGAWFDGCKAILRPDILPFERDDPETGERQLVVGIFDHRIGLLCAPELYDAILRLPAGERTPFHLGELAV